MSARVPVDTFATGKSSASLDVGKLASLRHVFRSRETLEFLVYPIQQIPKGCILPTGKDLPVITGENLHSFSMVTRLPNCVILPLEDMFSGMLMVWQ
jgi:hypothetical protein